MSLFAKIFGNTNSRFLKKAGVFVVAANELENTFEKLSIEELRQKTQEFKDRLANGETLDELLPEAFAAVRESAKRTLKQRHFDVQLIGGVALHEGKIAEMKTGEGKTLVATLPVYLNALEGKGVHVITVNDYLSRRDATWMGQIYEALGMTVGCINHEASYLYEAERKEENNLDEMRDTLGSFKVVHEFLKPCSRKEAYAADITYGTNNEFGFDYLRDNMAHSPEQVVQRGYNFVVVDEIDSVLIDEARTPLIISAPAEDAGEMYRTLAKITESLHAPDDYVVDEKRKAISITEQGIEKAEKLLGVGDIYTEGGIRYVHHLETALRAKDENLGFNGSPQGLFSRDKEYVVKNGEVIIVDESTGRLMPGRRWSEGLHQAVEAKEGVSIQKESRTYATVTFQNYFRMYKKLAGMTGTAMTSAEEFNKVYSLEVVAIPTNKPVARHDHQDLIFQTEKGKYTALIAKIKELHKAGQPVLIGTVSIQKNEHLSALLKIEGVPHQLLNAKNHEQEGEIIAQSGKKGAVTIATNMAGRGVDIKLGGIAPSNSLVKEYEQWEKTRGEIMASGGLCVIGTERHEARRIDNQLRGRAGRQGDPGETQFYVSMEDDLMRIFGSDKIKNMMARFGIPEDQSIENGLVSRAIESAQSKIEGFNFDARKHLLDYDDVMNHQRTIVYKRRKEILFGDDEVILEKLKEIFEKEGNPSQPPFINGGEFVATARSIMLQSVDMLWVEHLEVMDYLRTSVRLRAYGQHDPLVEYKNESLKLFRQLEASLNHTIVEMVTKISNQSVPVVTSGVPDQSAKMREIHNSATLLGERSDVNQVSDKPTVGRNDPCSCGSGKKYKKCCGK